MLLDIWVVIAAAQITLIALATAAVTGWRWRATARRNAELGSEVEAAQKALADGKSLLEGVRASRTWQEELEARILALDSGAAEPCPQDEIRRRVLRHELTGEPLDVDDLHTGGSDADARAEIEALRVELDTLRLAGTGAAPQSAERESELKALVQQFTHDSREMLSCIQALEAENKELRARVAGARDAA